MPLLYRPGYDGAAGASWVDATMILDVIGLHLTASFRPTHNSRAQEALGCKMCNKNCERVSKESMSPGDGSFGTGSRNQPYRGPASARKTLQMRYLAGLGFVGRSARGEGFDKVSFTFRLGERVRGKYTRVSVLGASLSLRQRRRPGRARRDVMDVMGGITMNLKGPGTMRGTGSSRSE